MSMGELAGRAVIVTGAGQGLGRAYALALAKAGANLVINDVDAIAAQHVIDEIVGGGARAMLSTHSVGTAEAADAIVATCRNAFGKVDGLVNNAAVHSNTLSWEQDPAEVERVIHVNLLGTILTGIGALKVMRAQGGGTVINIGSGAMFGQAGMSLYGATKAAALSLTNAWAQEYAGSEIRVFGILPWARTAMLLGCDERLWTTQGPEVAAPLVVYLMTPRAAPLHGRMIRMAAGEISLFKQGRYGDVLGQRFDWTTDSLHEALRDAASEDSTEPYSPHR